MEDRFGKRENWIRVVRQDTLYTHVIPQKVCIVYKARSGRKRQREEMKREWRERGGNERVRGRGEKKGQTERHWTREKEGYSSGDGDGGKGKRESGLCPIKSPDSHERGQPTMKTSQLADHGTALERRVPCRIFRPQTLQLTAQKERETDRERKREKERLPGNQRQALATAAVGMYRVTIRSHCTCLLGYDYVITASFYGFEHCPDSYCLAGR